MSKKGRGKSSASAGVGGSGRWESALLTVPVVDDHWHTNIQFIIENDLLDEVHTKALSAVVKIPQRRLFSHLRKEDLMEMVNELGNPKNKKPAKVPQYFEITEIIYGLTTSNQDVPLHLWAKLIKFGILNIKEGDVARRESDVAKGVDKGEKGGDGGKKRPRSKSPGKKGKKTPEPSVPKKDWSTLKKRGEDVDDDKYIDDEPDDGPQHYIFISGFHKAQLLPILEELGVYVNGVIKIQSESYSRLETMHEEKLAAEELDEMALAVAKQKRELDSKELALFWKLLPIVLQRAAPMSKLQDVGCLTYTVSDILLPTDFSDPDNMIGYGTALFEALACKVYDSLDWLRQYLNYLKHVDLLNIPKFGDAPHAHLSLEGGVEAPPHPPVSPPAGKKEKGKGAAAEVVVDDQVPAIVPPTSAEVDSRYYRDLISCVPMESVSVPLILHCMVEQVISTEQEQIPPSEREAPKRTDNLHLQLADCIASAMEGVSLTQDEENTLSEDFPDFKTRVAREKDKNATPEGPVLLHYNDDVANRTHHLQSLDGITPQAAEETIMKRVQAARLLVHQRASALTNSERSARLHELLRHTTSISSAEEKAGARVVSAGEMDRAFRQFVFESMQLSETDPASGLIRSCDADHDNIWDDPYTMVVKKIFSAENNPEKGAQEVEGIVDTGMPDGHKHLMPRRVYDNYNFTETYKPSILLEVLEEARQTYPCMDTYYHKRDNSLLVVFHSAMSDQLKAAVQWNSSLHSDVGFRNYLDYVADSITEWTKKEELKFQAELLAKELEKVASSQGALSVEPPVTPPRSKSPKSPKRAKSPNKKGSRKASASRSSSKAGGSDDMPAFSSPYIRTGSLKAEKEMQKKQQEEEDRNRKEGKTPGGGGKKGKSKSAASEDGKKPGSGKRSPGGKRSPSPGKKEKGRSKSPRSKSPRSRSRSKSPSEKDPTEKPEELPGTPKVKLPFTGYNVGNNLIHVGGKRTYLYPCDGGTITSELVQFEQGQTSVKVQVRKDGHVFMMHVLDPKDQEAEDELNQLLAPPAPLPMDASEKAETESQEKERAVAAAGGETFRSESTNLTKVESQLSEKAECNSLFSSWCANLSDGMTVSFSSNGPDGINSAATKNKRKILKLLDDVPPASTPTPVPTGGADSPGGKKGKGGKSPRGRSPKSKSPRGKSPKGKRKAADVEKEAEAERLEEMRIQAELGQKLLEEQEAAEAAKRKEAMPKFLPVYFSCPDGLTLRYELDPRAELEPLEHDLCYNLIVRQSYPHKTSGRQHSEKARAHPAMEEVSRLILSDGSVVKLTKDGRTTILKLDGTVYTNRGTGPIISEQISPITPHSIHSNASQQHVPLPEDQVTQTSVGSKKGSKGRRSSGKTNPEAPATDPSIAGTVTGQAAGLEAEAGAKLEAEHELAASWVTTRMSGEVVITKPDGTSHAQDRVLCFQATDPISQEVMYTREDKTVRVDRPDGGCVCDHSDGTRITRFHSTDANGKPIWYIRVECTGFATVTFNTATRRCLTSFGTGTTLLVTPDADYKLSHWTGGNLEVTCDGTATFQPRQDNDFYSTQGGAEEHGAGEEIMVGGESHSQPVGAYLMRDHAKVCCELVDHEGNVFQVDNNGRASVVNPSNIETGEDSDQPHADHMKPIITSYDHHPARLFVVHDDGTGTELLRLRDVHKYVSDAEMDPLTAVIKEPLPDDSRVVGITVMKPQFQHNGDVWLIKREEGDVIPENIRSQDISRYQPRTAIKDKGKAFGTTTGRGLAVGSVPAPVVVPPAPTCPLALEIRQLVQYPPISAELRRHLQEKLLEFGRNISAQERQREALKVQENRSAEEQMRANDLLQLVLECDEAGTPRSPDTPRAPALFPHQTGDRQPVAGAASDTDGPRRHTTILPAPDKQNSRAFKLDYEAAVKPAPPPDPPRPHAKLTQADWDMIRREVLEETIGREALKNRDVPSYFESEEGRAWLLSRARDLEQAAAQLAPDPRRDGSEASMMVVIGNRRAGSDVSGGGKDQERRKDSDASSSPEKRTSVGDGTASDVSSTQGTGSVVSDTPSKLRPTNPTPAHARGGGTPTKVRPDNPTPSHAQQTNNSSNPTPNRNKMNGEHVLQQQYQPSPIPENPTSAQRREVAVDDNRKVSQESRHLYDGGRFYDEQLRRSKDSQLMMTSLLANKPDAIPNAKFIAVEEPVRRKINTSSVAGGIMQGHLKVFKRGFQLEPPQVVFGVLREGSTYACTVNLRNVGIDLCRYKIKQPPPSTGITIQYTPGPVAAGMDAPLNVEIYAIAAGVEGESGVGSISHKLEIVSETDILFLPISATVLTAHDYDNRGNEMPKGGKAAGVRRCSDKPPSREGIIRPLKV